MSWYRILPTVTVVMVLIVLGANPALAGETVKTKSTGTSINTKWHEIEVGDTEGHVVAVYQNTRVWVSEITGERVPVALMLVLPSISCEAGPKPRLFQLVS